MSEADGARVLRGAKLLVAGIGAFLMVGAAAVIVIRGRQASALDAATAVHGRQYVATIEAESRDRSQALTLPGTLQGGIEATLYARTSGYVARWNKDIGSSVVKGEVLAEISAPEIQHQLTAAVAARAQAELNLRLAKSTAERWERLRQKDAVTQQDLEERQSGYRQAEANLDASEANVRRLEQLRAFTKVVAPFDGVVTRRSIDVGDLIDGGTGGTGRALFGVAQIDSLRLYVYVPQAYAHRVKAGDPVSITLAERSGESFSGVIVRTARAIDTTTRTMQVEIRVPNRDGALIAGSFVEVALPVAGLAANIVVPTDVLLFRPEGPRVALVDAEGIVHLRTVKLGTDFGDAVEVRSGLEAGARIITHPADSLSDGDAVLVVASATPAGAGGAAR
jgi:RND family efflux transporter MFP subunit